jgi:hypothetical protein
MLTGSSKRTTRRMLRALELRAVALNLVRAHGRWESAKNLVDCKFLFAEMGGFKILHSTPFMRLPEPPDWFKYGRALAGRPAMLPYGLNIWADGGGKVLFLEWDDKGPVNLVSFRRGEWEAALLSLTQVADRVA